MSSLGLLVSSFLLCFSFSYYSITVNGTTTCDEIRQCKDTEISDDEVICGGYFGCADSEIICTDKCLCTGDHGCHRAKSITSNNEIYCDGHFSCRYATIIGDIVYCNSYSSCKYMVLLQLNLIYIVVKIVVSVLLQLQMVVYIVWVKIHAKMV